MTDLPELAVVIPARDHEAALERLLVSLGRRVGDPYRLDVVVVDDASERDLAPLCAAHSARHLRLATPQGPARARNAGVAATRAPLLLLLDADVTCPPGLLHAIAGQLARRPEALAVSFLDPPYTAGVGVVANFAAALEHHWLSSYLEPGEDAGRLPGVTTRVVALRREAFEAVGGFDAGFATNAIEDYDFGKRLAARGPLWLAREPLVPHEFPRRLSRLVRNYFVRAATFVPYYARHRPSLDPVQVAPGEALLRIAGTLAGLLTVLAAIVPAAGGALALGAAVLLALHAFALRRFLASAARWSGSSGFALAAFGLHVATSPAIVAGAAWGLARALSGAFRGRIPATPPLPAGEGS